MSRRVIGTLLIGLFFVLWGCGAAAPSPGTETRTPIAAATPTPVSPSAEASPSPGPTVSPLTSECTLLDSHDVASLFSTAEVEGPTHQVGEVNHLIFSSEAVSATEASCIYYAFHNPGSKDMQLLQVTYWVDVAGRTPAATWDEVWTAARANAAQPVSGVGDDAFYNDGRLSFKKGIVYVTIEITSAGQNINVVPGSAQQLEMEKQIALDALRHMG